MKNPTPPALPPLPAHLEAPQSGAETVDRRNAARAAALADIQQMHDDLNVAHETIGQLRADLHREKDRVVLLFEERDKYRNESLVFRTKLVELATAMSNIGLLTRQAQDIMAVVHDLNGTTHHGEDVLTQLEAEIKKDTP